MSGADNLDRDLALRLYETMLKIRFFEQTESMVFGAGEQEGFVHLYIGEEAIAAGTCANLNNDDYITSTHRGHGHMIAKGGDMNRMMAELYGRVTGYCKGKSGSLHIADFDLGVLGANGIVGGGIPIAIGAGYSTKLRGTQQVAVAFFGEGAMTQGTFHESAQMAALWDLPVIFVVENNQWVVGSPITRVYNCDVAGDLSCRAAAYCMPGVSVDGNDPVAVYDAVKEAVERARDGGGPSIVNCRTYRIRMHFEGDIDLRDTAEVEGWRAKDPIARFEARMLDLGISTPDEIESYRKRAQQLVDAAVEFARKSPVPPAEEAFTDVYAKWP